MKFINYAIVKFSILLTLGIILASSFQTKSQFPAYVLIFCVILLGALWLIARKQLIQSIYFGFITYISFILIGYVSYQLRTPDLNKNHFSHVIVADQFLMLELKISEILKQDLYHKKYIAEIISIEDQQVFGKVLLYIKKDSTPASFTIDDHLVVLTKTYSIKPALNPYQFDYSRYMKYLGIYHQIKISEFEILKRNKGMPSLRGHAERIRNNIIENVRSYSNDENEFSIFLALVLGQRKEINGTMYDRYAKAGAIHILAVSGLHVGMIYLLLVLLLKPVNKFPYSKIVIPVFMVLILWGYATITGLSPSVIRSVTMFSLFVLAKNINRTTNSMNTLFLSYFILLLIHPLWLFQVGFQLSYLAVFFILWIQPKLYSYYRPRFYIDRLLWGIITVSISAQIGVVPLSLYYFHQFPGLFLITNVVILPFLSILLFGGILIILLALLNCLPKLLANSYWHLIELLNDFINWISSLENFIVNDIHSSIEKTLFGYLMMISVILLWKKFNFQRTIFSIVCIFLFIGVFFLEKYEYSKNEMVIFHKYRQTYVGLKRSKKFTLLKSVLNDTLYKDQLIRSYLRSTMSINYSEEILPNVFSNQNKLILVPDSLGNYPRYIDPDLLLLTNNPKLNLNRLIDEIEPKLIIADGNNYRSNIERWKSTTEERAIPFYYTGEKGAFIIR